MKINKYKVNQKVADTVEAGSSAVPVIAQKPSVLVVAIRRAIHSSPFIMPVFACALPGMAFANPEGGQVVIGSASISTPDADTTLITQATAQAVIDWQRFNIGTEEYVQFVQPDTSSVALNRVIGGDPSQILGNLSANGQVFLVNPNGIYFGQHATVDVGGIVASVLDISNDDFMAGNYVFSKAPGALDDAGVVNDGVITARDGGYVVLMGDYAHNNGIISARMGTVSLAAGNRVTMDVKGNGLVSVAIEEETFSSLAGVINTGEITAAGGRVIMSAKVANDLIDTAINNEGLVVANSIAERDGVIFLTAAGGDIVNSGTLDASAEDGSSVDGGGVLVYSDKNVINKSGAIISATGDGSGDGGVVRVIAEEFMGHQSGARIDVTSDAGDGGFVEVSGHGSLAIRGDVDLGTGGELLIDPGTLTITNSNNAPGFTTGGTSPSFSNGYVGKGFVESQLNSNTNVTLVANNDILAAGGSLGSTTATFAINATGTGNLSIVNGVVEPGGTLGACTMTGVCLPGGSNTVAQGATGNISLGTVSININGSLNIAGGSTAGSVSIGAINAGGNVLITAGSNIKLQGQVDGAGSIFVASAGNDIIVNGGFGSSDLGPVDAKVELRAGNNININDDVLVTTGAIGLHADKDGDGAGDVIIKDTFESRLTVSTQGNISVSGNNFIIKGAVNSSFGFASDAGVNVEANNIDVSLTGNMNISGGIYTPTSGTGAGIALYDVSVKASNGISISANSLTVQGGKASGNLAFTSSNLTVDASATLEAVSGNLTINVASGLNVAGGLANASAMGTTGAGTIAPTVTANANALIKAGGNITITAGSVNLATGGASTFESFGGIANANAKAAIQTNNAASVVVSNDITSNTADISASAIYMSAGNNIDLTTSNISVGNGTVPGIKGDANALAFMALNGIKLPTTTDPNAKFSAGGILNLGNITMDGDVPYLWLEADTTNILGSVVTPLATDIVVQFSPFTSTATIGVEGVLNEVSPQVVNYNNLDHFSHFPGTTIIIGSSAQTGEIVIGSLADIDIGSKNMVVVTYSKVTSISNVISTGIVAELLLGQTSFIPPVLTEVELPEDFDEDADEEKEKKKNLVKDDEEEINMCEAV